MPRIGRASARVRLLLVLLGLVGSVFFDRPALAQSLVSGSLRGEVLATDGTPIIGAQVTVTNRETGNAFSMMVDRRGRFKLALVIPGSYAVLAEQAGFQPIRQGGLMVRPGEETAVSIRLERRPPPIESIVDLPEPGRSSLSTGRMVGQDIGGGELQFFDFWQDLTGVSRDLSTVAAPADGRAGYVTAAGGLPQSFTRIFVDGLEQNSLRHPGVPGEPITSPLFSRNSLSGISALDNGFDAEWDGASGGLLAARSRVGSRGLSFRPYLAFGSSGLGGRGEDNPADSSATSIQAGAVLSGALVKDTAQFVLGFNYQTLERATANPWEQDSALFGGAPVSLRAALPVIAADTFGASVNPYVIPTVRSFRGGNAFGKVDWRLSRGFGLFARVALAKWKEQNPQLGVQRVSGLGARLEAHDVSGAIGLTASGSTVANELRLGLRLSKRDWISSRLPATMLVAEGAAIGQSTTVPADFDQRAIDINNTLQIALRRHHLKLGVGASFNKWNQNYVFAERGLFQFGDLDSFGSGIGTFFQVISPGSIDVSATDIEVFAQDVWSVSDAFHLQGGLRYEFRTLPSDKIALNSDWLNSSGILYETNPRDRNNIAPRLGFVWDVQDRGEWVIRGGGGLYYDRMDLALFSEAALYDGGAVVRRGSGTFPTWPAVPDSVGAPIVGPRLTLFDDGYQDPRTAKWDLALSHAFPGRITVEFSGAYHHTDYITRRLDLNRLPSASGQTHEGRPVYGTLVQQGGMVGPSPGSNRRFSAFDMVSGLVSSGFSDYYAATVAVERNPAQGLGLCASYTYSRTTDNWLLGASGDPADQLSPFPEATGSDDWTEGRSDLDIPHRFVVLTEYRFPGRTGVEVGIRFRYRSGLPFTPGFRPGVDPNGDGSGENDPALIDNSVAGVAELIADHECLSGQVGEFAERNSCREKAARALDLRLAVRLPLRVMGGDLRLVVDAFNLISTETGIVDRAVYLVDPARSLTTDASGNVTIPFLANSRFGSLLSRRGEPRLVRFGLKVDY